MFDDPNASFTGSPALDVVEADVSSAFNEELTEEPTIAARITRSVLEHAVGVANACGAHAVMVYDEALSEELRSITDNLGTRLLRVVKSASEVRDQDHRDTASVRVPKVALTRMGQVKIGLFHAMTRGLIKEGDVVVCVTGAPASRTLDNLLVVHVGLDSEMVTVHPSGVLPAAVDSDVVERVVEIACELGCSGREGRSVGTTFVVGDTEHVMEHSRQLILNPFRGYSEMERNLLHADLEETVKELATVDGAFIIRGDGVIEACAVHLRAAVPHLCDLPMGLGTRHHAAADITSVTDSIAVTVSESAGSVTIFRAGKIMTVIKKPRLMT